MKLVNIQVSPEVRMEVWCSEHNTPVGGHLHWRTIKGTTGLFELENSDLTCTGVESPYRLLCRRKWEYTLRLSP